MSNHDSSDIEAHILKLGTQTENILIVSDAEVAPHLVFLYIESTDDLHDFSTVSKLHKHLELAVRMEARKDSRRMVVIE